MESDDEEEEEEDASPLVPAAAAVAAAAVAAADVPLSAKGTGREDEEGSNAVTSSSFL